MCSVTFICAGGWKSPFGTQILYQVIQGYPDCESCWSFVTEFRSGWHTGSKTFFTFSFSCSAIGQRWQMPLGLGATSSCYQALGYGAQQSRLCCAHLADLVLLCLYPGTLRWTPPGILEGDNAAVSTTSIYWAHYQPPAPSGTDCVPFSCVLGSFSYQHMSNNRSTGARWTHSPVLPQSWLCRSYLCSEVHFCFYSSPRGFES